ncbi:uncharacterized WD repeat-containing protein C3H5.08c-like isoform X2 [Mercurialis annua]|uniref:uncharacterized WD repeat-containing protein C3H5.08c-like isoform X2 n=1 Tax=Mercurialis annua TaxID=3986 RepID=UPI00215E1309|nr:uncharacterized WD repeat-containing protein C3H5.08c-like isoform X2 [Mercurialis annua]
MGSLSGEEDEFFEAREGIASMSRSSSDCPENLDSDDSGFDVVDSVSVSFNHEVWIKDLGSIHKRRNNFFKWMGLNAANVSDDRGNLFSRDTEIETNRMTKVTKHSGAVLRSSSFADRFSSSHSSMSCWSNDTLELLHRAMEDNFGCRIRNLDDGTEFIVDELGEDGILQRIREVGSNRLLTVAEFERCLGLSPLVQQVMRRDDVNKSNMKAASKREKLGWLRRLGAVACLIDREVEAGGSKCNRAKMVRARSYKKRSKDFSALYVGQDIPAHKGSILTMKFSPDGQYLASAGEDGIVRVWQVLELERSDELGELDIDPSLVYLATNNFSELVPLHVDSDKKRKFLNLRTISNSACVVIPPKVFGLSKKPLHEFCGHSGEVLDLSWSMKKRLLSSSTDKTVRLWQVGYDQCLHIFSHNNYVTCVQFNPMDDDYFVSGSIDGKVRIWEITCCQVIGWTDIIEIVTAGLVVGSMTGNCLFYDALENHRLHLYAEICLQGKKKSPFKRITGFQFSPSDPTKLMVSSADSQVRILNGVDVVRKYRGLRNAGTQKSASFTSDGTHIISASEDSNVYVWNYIKQDGTVPQVKNNRACEHFFSNNASVAIPWRSDERVLLHSESGENLQCKLSFPSPDHSSMRFFSEALPKGSATWPEEKLASSSASLPIRKSRYKFLKTSIQRMSESPHALGLVIVTGGWDGRIRWFQNFGLPVRV